MILVDTAIWIDHFREGEPALAGLLLAREVMTHPLVVEELACGRLVLRGECLALLGKLPAAPVASHAELLGFIDKEGLSGTGIGVVDAHLLASARLARAGLWSRDGALVRVARKLGVLARGPGSA